VADWLLRKAGEADAEALAGVIRGAFEEYRGRLDPPSGALAETADTVREKMRAAQAVLALASGVPVGCVFSRPEEGRLYLFRLAVLPGQRGRGLGRALLAHGEGRAWELGLPRVRLGVRTALPRQIAFYEGLGYRRVGDGTHPGYAGPTYLLLERATRMAGGEGPAPLS
jgi:ribosomal protein S18 acetylase RimI-like enzyme